MAISTTGVRYDVIAKDSASKTFDKIGASANKLHSGLGKLAKGAAVAGAAIAAGIAAGLAVSTEKAVEFESTMKKIQTQAGSTAGDVNVLSKQVLQLGKTTQQGPQKLAEALYHLKSVGMDNVDAMKALKTSSDLAAVGGSDLEATTNALAGAWRTGIKGANSFAESAKTVNAIIGAGNMTMEDMVAALGTGILPTAKTFGLTFSQVGAALALFTDEGIDSASAATRLRMSISLLAAPSKASEKQLAKIGLTGNKLGEAMRSKDGIIGAITLLKDHLDKSGLSLTKQAALLSRAFGGGKSSSAILSMVNNLDVLRKKQIQVNASMDKYGPAVAAQRKTAAAQLALIKSNLEVFSIKTGNVLLPPLTKFVTYINATALPKVHEFGNDLVTRFIPIDRIKAELHTAAGMVTDFLAGLKGPKKKPTPLAVPLDLKPGKLPKNLPPDALKYGARVTATVTPKLKVPKNLPPDAFRYGYAPHPVEVKAKVKAPKPSEAKTLGAQLRGLISGGIGDAASNIDWGKLGKVMGAGLGKAVDWAVAHGVDISKKFATAVSGIDFVDIGKTVGSLAVPFVIGFIDNLMAPLFTAKFWEKHWLDTIIAVVSVFPFGKVFGKIGELFTKIPWGKLGEILGHIPWGKIFRWATWIGDTTGPALRAAGRFLSDLGTGFTSGFTRVFPKLGKFFSDQLYILPDRLGDAGRALSRKGSKLISDLGDAIVKGVPGMGNRFIRAIVKALGRFTLYQTGINLIEGLLNGAYAEMQGVGKWIENHVVNPVVNWTKSLFGVHSPSTVFASIGRFLISGLLGGILDGMIGVGKWLYNHVVSPVLSEFAGAGSWLYGKGSSLVSGLKNGIDKGVSGAGKWVSAHVKSPLVGALVKPAGWLYGKGKDVLTGFWNGLQKPWTDVQKWVGGIAKWIKANKGPISLDRQLLVPAGQALMHGLLNGLKVGFKGVGSFVHKTGTTIASTISGITSGIFGGGHNDLVGQWATDVRTVLGMLGASPDALAPVLSRIRMESGGNPNAINLTDANARAGHPSQGLMQTIPSTFATYAGPFKNRGITDPLASIYAGVNYAMHRYGKNWVKVMTRPGGYAAGGLAPFGQTAWVGERGPELMQVTRRGTRIYNNRDSMSLAKVAGIRLPGYASGTTSISAASAAESRIQREVNRLEAALKAAQHDRLTARTTKQRHADALEVEAAQRRLDAARTELTAAKKRLTTAQAQAKRVTTVSNALQNGFLKSLETSTASGIASAVKSMNSKLQAAGAGGLVPGNLRTASKLEGLATRKAGVAGTIATAKQYATDQASGLGDFLSLSNIPSSSIASLIQRMGTQQATAASFAAEVAGLSKKGLNKDLLSQLGDAGPGSQLAALFSKASASDIAKLNKLAASQAKLTVSFGQSMADSMYDSGKDAGKGFLTGLVSQEKALQDEMDKLATGMVNTIKKKLGIHSPSRVARDQLGKQFSLGLALGVRIHSWKAIGEAQRMADTMAAVRARSSAGGGAAPSPGGSQVVHHHHETNYTINARTADFTPRDLEVTQRRVEARQRVGRPR